LGNFGPKRLTLALGSGYTTEWDNNQNPYPEAFHHPMTLRAFPPKIKSGASHCLADPMEQESILKRDLRCHMKKDDEAPSWPASICAGMGVGLVEAGFPANVAR